jgi:hypothetical protein
MNKHSVYTAVALLALATAPSFAWAASCTPAINETEVKQTQEAWGKGLVAIGAAKDHKAVAEKFIADLYAYNEGPVLFKPTKAAEDEFRQTPDEALSYFVTGKIAEDKGFALAPYTKVRFENHAITYDCNTAVSMGNYYFTDTDGKETKVDYTMGFLKGADGKLKINIQHSSLPYSPH